VVDGVKTILFGEGMDVPAVADAPAAPEEQEFASELAW
jgi:hypothetical protein